MAQQWYYVKDGQRQGPVTVETLKELAASGQLVPSDLVWKEGMSQWAEAHKVKGLYPASDVSSSHQTSSPPPLTSQVKPTEANAATGTEIGTQGEAPDPSIQNSSGGSPSAASSSTPGAASPVWFVSQNKQQYGPFTFEQLKGMVAAGKIHAGDSIAKKGESWCVAWTFDGLGFPPGAQPLPLQIFGGAAVGAILGSILTIYTRHFLLTVAAAAAMGAALQGTWATEGPKAISLFIHPWRFLCILSCMVPLLCMYKPFQPEGKKLTALRVLIAEYQNAPSGSVSIKELDDHLERVKKVQNQFIEIPFDFKNKRDEAKEIVERYLDAIYDNYSGQLPAELHSHIEPMLTELNDDVKWPERLRKKLQ